jgi:hypothetical protein
MTGDAKPTERILGLTIKDFTAHTIGAEEEKIHALILTIASPCVFITIKNGDTETSVIVTQSVWSKDWENKILKNSKSVHSNIRKKTIN